MRRFRLDRRAGIVAAVVSVAVVTAVKESLEGSLAFGMQTPYLMYGGAVMVAAWLGGLWSGLVASTLSALAVSYFFLPPYHEFAATWPHVLTLIPFLIEGAVISAGAEALHRRSRRVFEGQKALASEKDLLAVTLKSIGDAVIVTNADGAVTFLNPEAERLTGWADAQARGRPIDEVFRIVNEQTRQEVESPVEKVLRVGGVVGLANHTLLIARDGQERPIDDSGAPIRSEGGPVQGVVLVFRDVTDQKRSEEAVRAAEREKALILDNANEIIAYHDLDQNLVWANQAYLDAMGARLPNLKGRKCYLCWGLDRVCLDCPVTTAIQTGRPQDGELTPANQPHWPATQGSWSVRAAPVRDGAGKIIGAIEVAHDITGRKRAEEALHRERDLLQTVMNGARASHLVYLDREFNFVRVNETYAASCGYKPDDMVGKNHFALYPHAENEAIFQRVRDTGEPVEVRDKPFEFPDQPERGVTYWDWTLLPVKDGRGAVEGLVFSLHETTDRKRAEEALVQANESLEKRVAERTVELERRASQLRLLAAQVTQAEHKERERLAKVLHDHLQQILVAAKLHTEMLTRGRDEDVRAVAARIGGLLDKAVAESRSLTTELSPPVLRDAGLVAGLGWLARQMGEQHGLEVRLSVGQDVEPADPDVRVFLFEAVRELLFNVVKHAGARTARVALERSDGQVRIRVEDDGKGLDPDALREGRGSATGFGLFSLQQRIQVIGGSMSISGGAQKGTRIALQAPAGETLARAAAIATAQDPPVAAGARVARAVGIGNIRVVLADDHKILRQGLASLLASEPDIEVVGEAADGAEAVDLARSLRPDVVVMDLTMPNLNGVEATRQIKAETPGVRVVGLSMHKEGDMAAAMREAGAVDFVTKGGPSEALVAAIRKAVGRPAGLRETGP